MADFQSEQVGTQAYRILEEVFREDHPGFNPIRQLVIGCSSSAIGGYVIGRHSSAEYGEAVVKAVLDFAALHGFDPAFQCCEHLNRALVMERAAAEKAGYEIVRVVPQLKAGGSLATAAWRLLSDPVAVLAVQADAGVDIGLTLIGMHLKRVTVPPKLENRLIGEAIVTAARTRPMLIGGERAVYPQA